MWHDDTVIREQTLSYYCNTNEEGLTLPVRGIVLEFPGLGGSSMFGGVMERGAMKSRLARRLGEAGYLLAFVFIGPWSYMNKGSVRIADGVVDCLRAKYALDDSIPLVAVGGSMGGLGSLIYAADSRHRIDRCVSACPCYDLLYYFEQSPDRARAVLTSVAGYDLPIEEAIRRLSPAHRLEDMPHIPYYVICDGADALFDADQMQAFAQALDDHTGGRVSFRRLEGVGHGGLIPEVRSEAEAFILGIC